MTPEIFAQALNALDARAPSAARLAAEAFFTSSPATAAEVPSAAGPVVRHNNAIALKQTPQAAATPSENELLKGARAPRVFRLDAGTVAHTTARAITLETIADVKVEAEPFLILKEPLSTSQNSPRRLPRKKARQRHGEVTIIRPEAPKEEPTTVAANEASDGGVQPQGDELSHPGQEENWPRYPALLRELRMLQAQAQEIKKAEVAATLRWIKAAIRDHGITAQELGLR